MVRALWLQGRREGRYCFGSRVRRESRKLRARYAKTTQIGKIEIILGFRL